MSTPVIEQSELTQIISETDLFPYDEDNDPNRLTHAINPPLNLHIWRPGMSAQDIVDSARLTGQEVMALCGFVFVPKHNPEKYEACNVCMNIARDLMAGNGE